MFQRVGKTAFKKDLTNTLKLMEVLGNPHLNFKSVHVAGTNGKGSTAHSISSVLMESGYKIGLYTSPHLKSFTERIKINGEEVRKSYVVDFVERIKPAIESIKPSFFEITVAMAFDYFAENDIDLAVIEVGMGGRFDSTNIIKPELSIITSIGLDHQEFLGNDLASIAFEKAGIIKSQIPVVISNRNKETDPVFIAKAQKEDAKIYFAQDDVNIQIGQNDTYSVESNAYSGEIDFDLKGKYQKYNLPGIFKAFEILQSQGYQINDKAINVGLIRVISNTGHNTDGLKQILEQIHETPFDKLWMVMGFVNDKELANIFELLPQSAFYIFCEAKIPRAKKAEEVLYLAESNNLKGIVVRDVNEAFLKAKEMAGANDFIFIGGSTFVVAEIEDL
jgi:dihydrofolate synthase/folylpolyglutamate synthase